MFASRYFAKRYFAGRYFPPNAGVVPPTNVIDVRLDSSVGLIPRLGNGDANAPRSSAASGLIPRVGKW